MTDTMNPGKNDKVPIPPDTAEILDRCPICGRECKSVKARVISNITFLLICAEAQEEKLFGCEACIRKALKKNLKRNIIRANIIWPVLILPAYLCSLCGLKKPGHSKEWVEWVTFFRKTSEEISTNLTASRKSIASSGAGTGVSRHYSGEPYVPHNGPFGMVSFGFTVLWAFIGLPVYMFFYVFACRHSFFAQIGVLLLLLFSTGHGAILCLAYKYSGNRSEWGIRIVSLLLGVWSVYLGWVAWFWITAEYREVILSPEILWRGIEYFVQTGFWKTRTVLGPWELGAVWLFDALALALIPFGIAWNTVRRRPFCPECGEPLAPVCKLPQFELPQERKVKKALASGKLDVLSDLPLRTGCHYLEVEVLRCNSCSRDCLLVFRTIMKHPDETLSRLTPAVPFCNPVWCRWEDIRQWCRPDPANPITEKQENGRKI